MQPNDPNRESTAISYVSDMEEYKMALWCMNYKNLVRRYNYDRTMTTNINLITRKVCKYDFIPMIKWLPNICRWLGLGKTVRRNKRRV